MSITTENSAYVEVLEIASPSSMIPDSFVDTPVYYIENSNGELIPVHFSHLRGDGILLPIRCFGCGGRHRKMDCPHRQNPLAFLTSCVDCGTKHPCLDCSFKPILIRPTYSMQVMAGSSVPKPSTQYSKRKIPMPSHTMPEEKDMQDSAAKKIRTTLDKSSQGNWPPLGR